MLIRTLIAEWTVATFAEQRVVRRASTPGWLGALDAYLVVKAKAHNHVSFGFDASSCYSLCGFTNGFVMAPLFRMPAQLMLVAPTTWSEN